MKIYTDRNYNIISLDTLPNEYIHEIETDKTREELFGKWCDECIRKYRYEPTYELLLDQTGNVVLNEHGNPIYKTDSNGNKIQNGWTWYPLVTEQLLQQIQDKNFLQMQIDDLTLTMAAMIGGVYNAS